MKVTIKTDQCILGIDFELPEPLPPAERQRLEKKCSHLNRKLQEAKIQWIANLGALAASVLGADSTVKIEAR